MREAGQRRPEPAPIITAICRAPWWRPAAGSWRREGPAALSLRAVAREAGVSPAAPYHHFKDKCELLDAVAKEGWHELGAAMAKARAQGARRARRPDRHRRRLRLLRPREPGSLPRSCTSRACDRETMGDHAKEADSGWRHVREAIIEAGRRSRRRAGAGAGHHRRLVRRPRRRRDGRLQGIRDAEGGLGGEERLRPRRARARRHLRPSREGRAARLEPRRLRHPLRPLAHRPAAPRPRLLRPDRLRGRPRRRRAIAAADRGHRHRALPARIRGGDPRGPGLAGPGLANAGAPPVRASGRLSRGARAAARRAACSTAASGPAREVLDGIAPRAARPARRHSRARPCRRRRKPRSSTPGRPSPGGCPWRRPGSALGGFSGLAFVEEGAGPAARPAPSRRSRTGRRRRSWRARIWASPTTLRWSSTTPCRA